MALLFCLSGQTAFAFSESDAQAQVDAAGREAVSGNVLVWFLRAIAFLKVSQKIDSFMSGLGVEMGHTRLPDRGGPGHRKGRGRCLRLLPPSLRQRPRQLLFPYRRSSSSPGGFMAGGLAGVVSRRVTNSAIRTATVSVVTENLPENDIMKNL